MEVTQELRRAKKRHFTAQSKQAEATDARMMGLISEMMSTWRSERKGEWHGDKEAAVGVCEQEAACRAWLGEKVLAPAKASQAVPDALCCPISFELYCDPVITPEGRSYERSCIEMYLRRESKDPVSRKYLTAAMLIPNMQLKKAAEDFLEKNPWAFESLD